MEKKLPKFGHGTWDFFADMLGNSGNPMFERINQARVKWYPLSNKERLPVQTKQ